VISSNYLRRRTSKPAAPKSPSAMVAGSGTATVVMANAPCKLRSVGGRLVDPAVKPAKVMPVIADSPRFPVAVSYDEPPTQARI